MHCLAVCMSFIKVTFCSSVCHTLFTHPRLRARKFTEIHLIFLHNYIQWNTVNTICNFDVVLSVCPLQMKTTVVYSSGWLLTSCEYSVCTHGSLLIVFENTLFPGDLWSDRLCLQYVHYYLDLSKVSSSVCLCFLYFSFSFPGIQIQYIFSLQ